MKKQKLRSLMMLCLLFLLGMVYSAHVFVMDSEQTVQTATTDVNDDNTESGEEKVKETSHHFFLLEKMRYHLKPLTSIVVNLNDHMETALPDAYLQLSTPPPDFA
ncbi:hypothetical protein [Pedobacter chitinilyticus]|uniref:Uncharacterized protein n=1 Tax=Pedobacter chitinilyticus TaxID=2233776 RepID=A0A443YRI0_9SPHI|nr:hypothetical protein [Pedobacter chitinilyticus]RWU06420.1 hypothetical protein DPV69_14120 [Pedobacter chitinilyticus]